METNYSRALQAEGLDTAEPWLLLKSVHGLFHAQFRRWFGIMAPTSLLGGAVLVMADQRVRAIYRSIPRGEARYHLGEIIGAGALRFGGFFLDWLLGCFALAAIATVVSDLDRGGEAEGWKHDSYHRAREHFAALVEVALITFVAFLSGIAAVGFVEGAVLWKLGWSHFSQYNYPIALILSVVVASFVSWIGVAIPVILQGNTRVRAALKKSVELSNGYEGALFLLVLESVAGSMIAWYAVVHGLPLLLPRYLIYTAWYGSLLNALGVLAGAAVDPPLFIGLSLLADPGRFKISPLATSEQTAQVTGKG